MQQVSVKTENIHSEKEPRIAPVENPDSLKMKLAYWITKQKIGKVITPMKVVQARLPETLSVTQKLTKVENNLSLPDELIFFIKSYVATLNGCSFCIDIAKAAAENDTTVAKYEALLNFRSSSAFSATEKAALTYVEEISLNKEVPDATFQTLEKHFSEKEIVEITWLNAMENYYNLINKPLHIGSDNLCALNS